MRGCFFAQILQFPDALMNNMPRFVRVPYTKLYPNYAVKPKTNEEAHTQMSEGAAEHFLCVFFFL